MPRTCTSCGFLGGDCRPLLSSPAHREPIRKQASDNCCTTQSTFQQLIFSWHPRVRYVVDPGSSSDSDFSFIYEEFTVPVPACFDPSSPLDGPPKDVVVSFPQNQAMMSRSVGQIEPERIDSAAQKMSVSLMSGVASKEEISSSSEDGEAVVTREVRGGSDVRSVAGPEALASAPPARNPLPAERSRLPDGTETTGGSDAAQVDRESFGPASTTESPSLVKTNVRLLDDHDGQDSSGPISSQPLPQSIGPEVVNTQPGTSPAGDSFGSQDRAALGETSLEASEAQELATPPEDVPRQPISTQPLPGSSGSNVPVNTQPEHVRPDSPPLPRPESPPVPRSESLPIPCPRNEPVTPVCDPVLTPSPGSSPSGGFASNVVSDALALAVDAVAMAGRVAMETVETLISGKDTDSQPEPVATYSEGDGCQIKTVRGHPVSAGRGNHVGLRKKKNDPVLWARFRKARLG